MTIHLVGRRSSSRRPGGDAMQVSESAEVGRSAGLDVRVEHKARRIRPAAGDVVHLFDLQRCHDWGRLPERTRDAGARLLITPLYHPLDRYHRQGRTGLDGLAAKLVPDPDRLAGLRWGRVGLRRRAAEVLEQADLVLLAHEREAELLHSELAVDVADHSAVVPVAIPEPPDSADEAEADEAAEAGSFVLCAGRVEPLKNPVAVARAARSLGLPVRFAGAGPGLRHRGYARGLVGGGDHLGPLAWPVLQQLMARARVHALASWTEVVGRVTLEAALAGAAVVLSDVGHAPEMLGRDSEGVFLFEPGDDAGLERALERAWERGRRPDSALVRRVRDRFTWNAVGPLLREAWGA
jgi:glycosyltransferase involved in cell wall biosynthesis